MIKCDFCDKESSHYFQLHIADTCPSCSEVIKVFIAERSRGSLDVTSLILEAIRARIEKARGKNE